MTADLRLDVGRIAMYSRYAWAVLRHKWFVFVECCKLGIPWLGVVHDLSKFLPGEFVPYARYFYGPWAKDERKPRMVEYNFDMAWLHHQHRNRHHWQRWMMTLDSARKGAKHFPMPMPERFAREMLADWRGAGRAYGNSDTLGWYSKNRMQISLYPGTREWIEEQLGYTPDTEIEF